MNRDTLLMTLARLAELIDRLDRIGKITWEDIESDECRRCAVEHVMSLIAQCATDIASGLLAEVDLPSSSSSFQFLKLHDCGFISKACANKLACLAATGNLLGTYLGDVNSKVIHQNISPMKVHFSEFIAFVREHLDESDESNGGD